MYAIGFFDSAELEKKLIQNICQIELAEGRKIERLSITSKIEESVDYTKCGYIEYDMIQDGKFISQEEIKEKFKQYD